MANDDYENDELDEQEEEESVSNESSGTSLKDDLKDAKKKTKEAREKYQEYREQKLKNLDKNAENISKNVGKNTITPKPNVGASGTAAGGATTGGTAAGGTAAGGTAAGGTAAGGAAAGGAAAGGAAAGGAAAGGAAAGAAATAGGAAAAGAATAGIGAVVVAALAALKSIKQVATRLQSKATGKSEEEIKEEKKRKKRLLLLGLGILLFVLFSSSSKYIFSELMIADLDALIKRREARYGTNFDLTRTNDQGSIEHYKPLILFSKKEYDEVINKDYGDDHCYITMLKEDYSGDFNATLIASDLFNKDEATDENFYKVSAKNAKKYIEAEKSNFNKIKWRRYTNEDSYDYTREDTFKSVEEMEKKDVPPVLVREGELKADVKTEKVLGSELLVPKLDRYDILPGATAEEKARVYIDMLSPYMQKWVIPFSILIDTDGDKAFTNRVLSEMYHLAEVNLYQINQEDKTTEFFYYLVIVPTYTWTEVEDVEGSSEPKSTSCSHALDEDDWTNTKEHKPGSSESASSDDVSEWATEGATIKDVKLEYRLKDPIKVAHEENDSSKPALVKKIHVTRAMSVYKFVPKLKYLEDLYNIFSADYAIEPINEELEPDLTNDATEEDVEINDEDEGIGLVTLEENWKEKIRFLDYFQETYKVSYYTEEDYKNLGRRISRIEWKQDWGNIVDASGNTIGDITSPSIPGEGKESAHEIYGTYQSYIDEASEKYGLDPWLIVAIIGTESAGKPEAYNASSGASGLMQVLASHVSSGTYTLDALTGKEVVNVLSEDDLFDIDLNIEIGASLLRQHIKAEGFDIFKGLQDYSGNSSYDNFVQNYVEGDYKLKYWWGNEDEGPWIIDDSGSTQVKVTFDWDGNEVAREDLGVPSHDPSEKPPKTGITPGYEREKDPIRSEKKNNRIFPIKTTNELVRSYRLYANNKGYDYENLYFAFYQIDKYYPENYFQVPSGLLGPDGDSSGTGPTLPGPGGIGSTGGSGGGLAGQDYRGVYSSSSGRSYYDYFQGGPTWGNVSFANGRMASKGCSATAVATILTGYGFNVDPGVIGKNYNCPGVGLYWTSLTDHVNVRYTGSYTKQSLLDHLSTGNAILLHFGSGPWAAGSTHYVAAIDVDLSTNRVYISNPNSNSEKHGWVSIDSIVNGNLQDVRYISPK